MLSARVKVFNTFEYKLKIITRAAEISETGNRAAATEFEIDEIRYWKKDAITTLPKRRTSLAKLPALERTLKDWGVSQRENSRAVTTVMIRLKAKELAKQMNVTEFVGGPSWCNRFMRRNRFSVRFRTTVGQNSKLPNDWEENTRGEDYKLSPVCFTKKGLTFRQIAFSTWMKCQCPLTRLIPELLIQPGLRVFLCQLPVTRKQASLLYSRVQSQGKS